jgi:hypothetical protein
VVVAVLVQKRLFAQKRVVREGASEERPCC